MPYVIKPPNIIPRNMMETLCASIAFAAIAAACIFKFIISIIATMKKKRRSFHPVAGTILQMLLNIDRLYDYLSQASSRHKTFRILHLTHSMVYTTDPANVEHILKTNFHSYGKGEYQHTVLQDLLGDGIFTVDGDKWRHQRKTSSYEFSTKILRDFSSGVFKKNASKLASIVSEAASSNQTIEIQDLFMKSALDSVFKVVLGVELDSIHGTYEDGTRFSRCFDEASAMTLLRYFDVFWKLKRRLNIGSEAKLKKNMKVVDDFVYKIIKSKTEQLHGYLEKEDLLSRFLDKDEKDPKYLKDIILSFIIAGKDTTAGTLSWFFYMMCKHPDVQDRIAEEVARAASIDEGSCISNTANSITEEPLENMQYLHAALTETLRLYPAVPVDGKACFSDDTLPDGFNIRKGDSISYQPWAMGRMKYLWGDDAEEFKPERWLDENGVFQQQSPFKFTAFQAGPRICLGKEFAYKQMKIFAAVLLGHFTFELSDEQKQVKYKTMLTLQIDGGLHLKASCRSI